MESQDFSFLDQYDDEAAPERSQWDVDVASLPEGVYDFTLAAMELVQPKPGLFIAKWRLVLDGTTYTYSNFLKGGNQKDLNILLGNLQVLGVDVSGWGKKVPLRQALPAAVASLKDVRFRGNLRKSQGQQGDKWFPAVTALSRLGADAVRLPKQPIDENLPF